jgi:hypothetical protein
MTYYDEYEKERTKKDKRLLKVILSCLIFLFLLWQAIAAWEPVFNPTPPDMVKYRLGCCTIRYAHHIVTEKTFLDAWTVTGYDKEDNFLWCENTIRRIHVIQ